MQDNLSRATGLSSTQTNRLLAILAPILLGALSRGRTRGASLGDLLGGAQRQATQSGAGMDFVSQMLDANRDGSALDDVARIGTSLLGGLFGKK